MKFIPVEKDNKSYLWQIYKKAMKNHIEQIWGWDVDWQKKNFDKNLNKYQTCLVVKNKINIGYLQFNIIDNEAYINMLILDESHQSQGIGKEVLDELVRKNQVSTLSLRCFKVNKRAYQFYLKESFDVIVDEENFYLLSKKANQKNSIDLPHLFVYGTLGPGKPNEHIMKEIGGSWQQASVFGYLYEKGWGAQMGYPGIKLDEKGKEVKGFIFTSENLINHWKKLDEFEGEGYQRIITNAKLEDDNIIDTYIYALSKPNT